MTLLLTNPPTRSTDLFVTEGQKNIDFTDVVQNFRHPIVKGKPIIDHRFVASFYDKIGVDIVTESLFNYPYPFITEKTYRPMASLRPFILIGPYQSLSFLKSLGFKTFSAIINESYDAISDPELRFLTVCESIKTFVSQPLEHIKQDLRSIEDILVHNQTHLSKLVDMEIERFKEQL